MSSRKSRKNKQLISVVISLDVNFTQSNESYEVLPLNQMNSNPNIYDRGERLNGKPQEKGEAFTKNEIYFIGLLVIGVVEC
jgi:hypothetical protein